MGLTPPGNLFRRLWWSVRHGVSDALYSRRGRRTIGVVLVTGFLFGLVQLHPVTGIEPGEIAFRVNKLTGHVDRLREGWALAIPGVHTLRRYSLREQIYQPEQGARANGPAPYQSIEGLSLGATLTIRYAFDADRLPVTSGRLPEDISHAVVEPLADGVVHRIFATHTVKEIFSTKRVEIQQEIEDDLRPKLAEDSVILRSVFLGNVDLPAEYRQGLESMLTEELGVEKMKFTLDLKQQEVKEAELSANADKVRRERAAEAAGNEQIIAAKAQAEAMQHILPFKEKEIEQRRLEAEAAKVARLSQADGEAQARRIESAGEADARRKLAEADAYRVEVTGKAASEQLARDAALISANPLLIQKTLADKLSDKISVVIAPPQVGGFFASGLLGGAGQAPKTQVAAQETHGDDSHDRAVNDEGAAE
jgi:regulator of protease activity HflC (stomatin/prohibitin superfamily)